MVMQVTTLKQWMVAGMVTIVGACGDSTGTTESQGGSGTDSTGATSSPTEATPTEATTVGQTDSVTEGSASDSQTMGTTTSPTDPTTDPTTSTSSTSTGTDTTPQTDTGTTEAVGDTTTGTTDGTTGEMLGPCGEGKQWTLDADFDAGILNNVNHDQPNGDQLQITIDGVSAPKPYMFVAQTSRGWVLKIDTETGKRTKPRTNERTFSTVTATRNAVTGNRAQYRADGSTANAVALQALFIFAIVIARTISGRHGIGCCGMRNVVWRTGCGHGVMRHPVVWCLFAVTGHGAVPLAFINPAILVDILALGPFTLIFIANTAGVRIGRHAGPIEIIDAVISTHGRAIFGVIVMFLARVAGGLCWHRHQGAGRKARNQEDFHG